MRPVDDETVIRTAALRALEQLSQNGTARLVETERFDRESHFLDLAAFLTYLRAADPARAGSQRGHFGHRFWAVVAPVETDGRSDQSTTPSCATKACAICERARLVGRNR